MPLPTQFQRRLHSVSSPRFSSSSTLECSVSQSLTDANWMGTMGNSLSVSKCRSWTGNNASSYYIILHCTGTRNCLKISFTSMTHQSRDLAGQSLASGVGPQQWHPMSSDGINIINLQIIMQTMIKKKQKIIKHPVPNCDRSHATKTSNASVLFASFNSWTVETLVAVRQTCNELVRQCGAHSSLI